MLKFPINFSLNFQDFNSKNILEAETSFMKLRVDIPQVFGGNQTALSPEEYYMFSLVACFFTTLQTLAKREKIEFECYNIVASSKLDRGLDSKPFVKEIFLDFECSSEYATFDKVIEFAKENCFILNSVKTQINIKYKLN